MADGIHRLVQSIFDEKIREEILDEMFEDGNATTISENKLNENFSKKEFQELWKSINHKYAYTEESSNSGMDITINGETFFMPHTLGFEEGDKVVISYLPKSKFILSIYHAEEAQ